MKKLIATLTSSAVMLGAAHASTVDIIDFSGYLAGVIIDDEYAADGVTFATTSGTNAAIVFDTNRPTGNDADLLNPFELYNDPNATINPGNILVIADDKDSVVCNTQICFPPDDEASGGTITATFDEAVTFLGFNAFDVTDGSTFTANFYDLTGAMVGTVSAAAGVGDNQFQYLAAEFDNVKIAEFIFGGSGGIDDLTFLSNVSEVPIPGALPLLLSGLALGGFASRKRKKATV